MPHPLVDDVKQRIDIIELVSQKVVLNKAGRYFKGLCPFHPEKTPSFVVYPDQGNFHCFGCGKSGDIFTWVQETEHLDFGEALRQLAARAGVQLPQRTPRPDPEAQASAGALQQAAAWYHAQLLRAANAEPARRYLRQRGLTPDTLERFGLGWAPDEWDALTSYLRAKGFSARQLEDGGLVVRGERGLHDRFRGRVIFPIRDTDGRVCGFGGRVVGDEQPKYLNSPQTPYFDKGAMLYALDLAKPALRRGECAVVVEGYLDAVLPHQAGFTNVVASLGTALTERQIALLKRYTTTIVLALDADAAGQAATLRALEVARQALYERRRPVPGPATRTGYLQLSAGDIKIAVLRGGKDPDEIVREGPGAWQRLIEAAVPMMEHKLAVELAQINPHDPGSKAAAVEELARFLVQVPDPIEWAHYIDRIAQRLRVDIRAVRDEVDRAVRALRRDQRRREAAARVPAAVDGGSPARPGGELAERAPAAPPAGQSAELARQEWRDESRARAESAASRAPSGDQITEEHCISLLVLAPQLVRRLPTRLEPADFRRPECRELYSTVLAFVEGKMAPPAGARRHAPPEPAEASPDDPFRLMVDAALRDYYDVVLLRARRLPPQTESQLEADLSGVVRRIKERNLREQLREAQYLLAESGTPEERLALERQVDRLAAQLGRVQLERSRTALYVSSPN